jgi:hypothetical protein
VSTSIDQIRLADGSRVHCGLIVTRTDDPFHVARIEKIHSTMKLTVKWENGWDELGCDPKEFQRWNGE